MEFELLADRQRLVKVWKQSTINFTEVKQRMMDIMVHEKLTEILNDTLAKFLNVWTPWLDYDSHMNPDRSLPSL